MHCHCQAYALANVDYSNRCQSQSYHQLHSIFDCTWEMCLALDPHDCCYCCHCRCCCCLLPHHFDCLWQVDRNHLIVSMCRAALNSHRWDKPFDGYRPHLMLDYYRLHRVHRDVCIERNIPKKWSHLVIFSTNIRAVFSSKLNVPSQCCPRRTYGIIPYQRLISTIRRWYAIHNIFHGLALSRKMGDCVLFRLAFIRCYRWIFSTVIRFIASRIKCNRKLGLCQSRLI